MASGFIFERTFGAQKHLDTRTAEHQLQMHISCALSNRWREKLATATKTKKWDTNDRLQWNFEWCKKDARKNAGTSNQTRSMNTRNSCKFHSLFYVPTCLGYFSPVDWKTINFMVTNSSHSLVTMNANEIFLGTDNVTK